MSRLSELEMFLQNQVNGGERDSSGQFTLSRSKALEKLAAFQLPRPSAWVLKVVQAAVSARAPALEIKQTSSDTEFYFLPQESWTLAEFEEAFFDPQISPRRGLDCLKRGLWSVALNDMHPFRIRLPDCTEALIWTGQEFQRQPCSNQSQVCLTVSHRTYYERTSAARVNASILQELRGYAYFCPVPLTLDGRRLDAVQGCPSHGLTPTSYPVQLGFAEGAWVPLTVPPGTFNQFTALSGTDKELSEVMQLNTPSSQASVVWLLTAHLGRVDESGKKTWQSLPSNSFVHWVLDGVIVGKETLRVDDLAVSCALFLSAEGLALDITGFGVIKNEAKSHRLQKAVAATQPLIAEVKFSLEDFLNHRSRGKLKLALVGMLGGFLLASLAPGSGWLPASLLIGGGLHQLSNVCEVVPTARLVEADFPRFQEEWARFDGQTMARM